MFFFLLCRLCVSQISAQFLNPCYSYFQHPTASRVHIQFQISPKFCFIMWVAVNPLKFGLNLAVVSAKQQNNVTNVHESNFMTGEICFMTSS